MKLTNFKGTGRAVNVASLDRENLSRLLFYIGYVVWLVWKLISISMFSFAEGSMVNTILHGISLLCFFASSISLRIFDSKTIFALVFCAFGLLIKVNSGNILFIDLALIFYASRCTQFDRIAQLSLALLGVGSIAIVFCSVIGIVPDYLFSRGETIRHGLGFLYSTNLSHLYLNIILLYLFVRRDSIRCSECLLLFSIDILIFILTDSRNSCGLVAIALVISCVFKMVRNEKLDRLLAMISRCSFGVFTILLLIAALAYDPGNEAWRKLNKITSNRIAQDHASLIKYGAAPFGQEIEFSNRTIAMGERDKTEQQTNPEGDPNIVESSFLNILITKGYVTLLLVLLAFWIAMRYESDRWISLILLMISMHSAFDFQLTNLLYTTFLMWVWDKVASTFVSSSLGLRLDQRLSLDKER